MKSKSLFRALTAPYYIAAPDYRRQSAGIRAMHYLCHALNEIGEEAYVTCDVTMASLRTPRLTKSIRRQHEDSGREPIIVYPEVVFGNPLNGRIVVRWLLNRPGHLSGDKVFDDRDMLFYYLDQFVPEEIKAEPLYLPTVDMSIFNNVDNPDDNRRSGTCFYAHKFLAKGGQLTTHAANATSLCQDEPHSQQEIARILRRSELLYVYEPTALIHESLLCGCPVSVIVTDYWKSNTNNWKGGEDYGIAFSDAPEAIALAKKTVGLFTAQYEAQLRDAWEDVERFVELTQRRYQEFQRPSPVENKAMMSERVQTVDDAYGLWRLTHSQPIALDMRRSVQLVDRPVFHILFPVLAGQESTALATISSILQQSYVHSRVSALAMNPLPAGIECPHGVVWRDVSETGFMVAVNTLVQSDISDWYCFVSAGDQLESHALTELAQVASNNPGWSILYTDEDNLNEEGKFVTPFFKSNFSLDMFRSAPYVVGGLLAIKRELLARLGGLRPEMHGAEYFDLVLRAYEDVGEHGIGHVADILYHRNVESGNALLSEDEVIAARRTSLLEHLGRIGSHADVHDGILPGTFHIRYRLDGQDTVSIIVPTMNGGSYLQRCVAALVENTDYQNWEIIVVDQGSDDPDTLAFLGLLRDMDNDAVHVLAQPRASSLPSLINAGARQARGKYLLFLADSSAPLRRDWLDEMLGYASQSGVGVVGAKMIGHDSNVSFAGYILGMDGKPAGLHDLHAQPDALGYFGQLQVTNNPSAVSANCMLTGKALFEQLGGFDEKNLEGGYSDVDYCLKSWQAGRRVVWTPFAALLQEHLFDPPPAADEEDECDDIPIQRAWHLPTATDDVMFDRWLDRIAFDPAYNRNLSLSTGAFEIELVPALTWDPGFRPLPRILAHTGDRQGCGEYRIIAPMRALLGQDKIHGWETGYFLTVPELARMAPDSLILQRQIGYSNIVMMGNYFAHSKAFRVFELDDLMTNIQIANQARQAFQAKDLVKRFRKALDMCDRFVVSTDYLAEEYRKFKSEIVVVPNTMERAKWGDFRPARRAGRKPRVGWAGSVSHAGDLALIADVVKALKDEVEWVFFGLCPEGVRPLVEYHAGVPIDQYPARLASLNLDLALAPLEDVPFNHAKSHLRLLEYGVLGYPVICTDITPYRGDYPVTRVRNRFKDWVDAIREHLSDMDELARRGDALRDHVNSRWILEDNLDIWLKAWLP